MISTSASLSKRAKRHPYISKTRKGVEIAVGDVVILMNDNTQRKFWKLAVVEELLPSKDGIVRAARVKVASGDRNPRIFARSVKHLFSVKIVKSVIRVRVYLEQSVQILM